MVNLKSESGWGVYNSEFKMHMVKYFSYTVWSKFSRENIFPILYGQNFLQRLARAVTIVTSVTSNLLTRKTL